MEFALIAAPFIGLTFAIVETGIVLFGEQYLETAVTDTAREVFTGNMQKSWSTAPKPGGDTPAARREFFLTELKKRVPVFLDADKIIVCIDTPASMAGADMTAKTNGSGQLDMDPSKCPMNFGASGSVVAVRAYYPYPLVTSFVSQGLANYTDTDGTRKRLLVATSVFRNEPF